MENFRYPAEISGFQQSLKPNGKHHSLDDNLSQINSSNNFGDSGYNSCHITPTANCTPNLFSHHSNVSNGSSSSSVVYNIRPTMAGASSTCSPSSASTSSLLMTIDEDVEIENQEPPTPTTRNIQKILALHLTTPKFKENSLIPIENLSPMKRTATDSSFSNSFQLTPKKMRIDNQKFNEQIVMKSITPQKQKMRRKPSFRDRLQSDPCLFESENSQLPLSPISVNHNATNKIHPERKILFESKSSTPINFRSEFFIERMESVRKNSLLPKSGSPKKRLRLLRKIQSFSPNKLDAMNRRATVRTEQYVPSTKKSQQGGSIPPQQASVNPAKKLLEFDSCAFQNLLNGGSAAVPDCINDKEVAAKLDGITIPSIPATLNEEDESLIITPVKKKFNLVRQNALTRESPKQFPDIEKFFDDIKQNSCDSFEDAHARSISLNRDTKDKVQNFILKPVDSLELIREKFHIPLTPDKWKPQLVAKIGESNDLSIDKAKSTNSMDISITPGNESFADANIKVTTTATNESELIKDNRSIRTEKDLLLSYPIQSDQQQQEKYRKRNANFMYSPSVLSTPKKIRRSVSLHYASEIEKHQILYPYLPCTPPKNRAKKSLKRLNFSKVLQPSPAKKRLLYKQIPSAPKRKTYEGYTKLNILSRLANTAPALDKILDYLSADDLMNVCRVSKQWMTIVENNPKANKKRLQHMKQLIPLKENTLAAAVKKSVEGYEYQHPKNGNSNREERIPFGNHNSLMAPYLSTTSKDNERKVIVIRSPPVSPSKRKFHENQKIVKNLDREAQLTTCPRCTKPSIIYSPRRRLAAMNNKYRSPAKRNLLKTNSYSIDRNLKSPHKIRPEMRKSSSVPIPFCHRINTSDWPLGLNNDNDSDDNPNKIMMTTNLNGNHTSATTTASSSTSASYAECSGRFCGYRFCINCLYEYQPHHKCNDILPLSPMKVEDEMQLRNNTVGSKRSKRNLKRLCF